MTSMGCSDKEQPMPLEENMVLGFKEFKDEVLALTYNAKTHASLIRGHNKYADLIYRTAENVQEKVYSLSEWDQPQDVIDEIVIAIHGIVGLAHHIGADTGEFHGLGGEQYFSVSQPCIGITFRWGGELPPRLRESNEE